MAPHFLSSEFSQIPYKYRSTKSQENCSEGETHLVLGRQLCLSSSLNEPYRFTNTKDREKGRVKERLKQEPRVSGTIQNSTNYETNYVPSNTKECSWQEFLTNTVLTLNNQKALLKLFFPLSFTEKGFFTSRLTRMYSKGCFLSQHIRVF